MSYQQEELASATTYLDGQGIAPGTPVLTPDAHRTLTPGVYLGLLWLDPQGVLAVVQRPDGSLDHNHYSQLQVAS